jgi:putative tricarboxylic transport membrane protein
MGRLKKWSLETAFDFLLAVLGIVILITSLAYGLGTLRRPGPGLYPFFIGLSVVIFGMVLFIQELRPQMRPPLFNRGDIKTLLFMVVTFCLWILMIPLLGYVLVTLLVTYGFCKMMKLEGLWKPLSISAGTALFIYLLFDYWLYIDLPRGIWG